jgi:hypothetical protein
MKIKNPIRLTPQKAPENPEDTGVNIFINEDGQPVYQDKEGIHPFGMQGDILEEAPDDGQTYGRNGQEKTWVALDEHSGFATFVIDSNEKLQEWVNNSNKNDYSHVLIKSGFYGLDDEVTVNLTNTGTYAVTGEANSRLHRVSLSYDEVPPDVDYNNYFIKNVTISYGTFSRCINLYNCKATAYEYCNNINGCTANSIAMSTMISNCRINVSQGSPAFTQSSQISNCTVTMLSNNSTGFVESEMISNCTVNSNSSNSVGFKNCEKITDCSFMVNNTGSSSAVGFKECIDIKSCYSNSVPGFSECRVMFGCSGQNSIVLNPFHLCYMNITGDTNPVGDTATGGYNRFLLIN